jgi:hypothetical protein
MLFQLSDRSPLQTKINNHSHLLLVSCASYPEWTFTHSLVIACLGAAWKTCQMASVSRANFLLHRSNLPRLEIPFSTRCSCLVSVDHDQTRHMLLGRPFEAATDQQTTALAVLKPVGFRALLAKPEVLHRVRVPGLRAGRMTLVKTEVPPLTVIERGRTV